MKKNYLSCFVAMACTFLSANAQFTDDFESYPLGSYHGGNWSSWTGNAGVEDIIISSNFAYDGTKSGLIGGDLIQDAMLNLGNQTSGMYQLSFQMYIPAGKSGYMNFQGTTSNSGGAGSGGNGLFLSPNLVFNNSLSASGSPGVGGAYQNVNDPEPFYTWVYPEDDWFPVLINFDVDNGVWSLNINGVAVISQPFGEDNVLGGIDFFSFSANNEMYIDAISFDHVLSVDEGNLNSFQVYPNPVKDYLYLSINSVIDLVEIYDVLGHKVLSITPGVLSPKIDFSNLSSGSYFVKASTGNQSMTFKIIK